MIDIRATIRADNLFMANHLSTLIHPQPRPKLGLLMAKARSSDNTVHPFAFTVPWHPPSPASFFRGALGGGPPKDLELVPAEHPEAWRSPLPA